MKKLITGLILTLMALASHATTVASLPSGNGEMLALLDRELANRDTYIERRVHRIDSLKKLMEVDTTGLVGKYLEFGNLVSLLNCDSAIAVLTRGYNVAVRQGDSVNAQCFQIYRASELRKFGATPDAIKSLENIYKSGIYPENAALYNEVGRDLNLTMAEIFDGSPVSDSYLAEGLGYAQRQLESLHFDSPKAQIAQSLVYFAQGKRTMSVAVLHELVYGLDIADPDFSMAMTILGGHYYHLGRNEESVRYLALAAYSDIISGNSHGSALIRLGMALYASGDIVRAHNYLSAALDCAVRAGEKNNLLLVSEALRPVSQELNRLSNRRLMLLIGLIVTLVVIIFQLWVLYRAKKRRVREVEHVKRQLATSNKAKETYISEFINLCSGYMESLEDFNRICRRKITAGQSEDLLKFIRENRALADQRKKFDDIFDESFLAIYPTFLEELNRLLLPDKQVVVPAPNVLTTELRVLALTRLGIDDTAQVARFLGVSTNTIYTYRNKFRNMAINRDTFDADILRIGNIE